MNRLQELVQSPAKRVALAIVIVVVAILIGGAVGSRITASHYEKVHAEERADRAFRQNVLQSIPTDSAYDSGQYDGWGDNYQDDTPFLPRPHGMSIGPVTKVVYPEVLPVDMIGDLIQSDGGQLSCNRSRATTAVVPTTGTFTYAGQKVQVSEGEYGILITPQEGAIQARRVAVIMDGVHAAWLPATARGARNALDATDWVVEGEYFSPTLHLCFR